ncbi:hypothetical protein H5T52_01730 [Candidatus Bipolaricaulota bacterium]|nr:hypothetical protein [Candidatus Bipolaricaulota bacterium]
MSVRFGVYSGDPLAVERALARRLSQLGAVERVTLFGDELELGRLLSELGTRGLFGGEKAVVVRRADPIAGQARLAEALRRGPPPGTALFLVGQELKGPLVRLADESIHFPTPTGRALKRLAEELLAQAGLEARPELVELLVEAAGGDTLHLASEVEKLSLWNDSPLPQNELPRLLFFFEPTPYAFLDALGKRLVPASLAELRRLLSSGWDPFRLFFLVISHLRTLLSVRAAWEEGRQPPGPDWLIRKRLAQARLFPQPELIRLLGRLQELDLKIKTGALTPQGALELFILELSP